MLEAATLTAQGVKGGESRRDVALQLSGGEINKYTKEFNIIMKEVAVHT